MSSARSVPSACVLVLCDSVDDLFGFIRAGTGTGRPRAGTVMGGKPFTAESLEEAARHALDTWPAAVDVVGAFPNTAAGHRRGKELEAAVRDIGWRCQIEFPRALGSSWGEVAPGCKAVVER